MDRPPSPTPPPSTSPGAARFALPAIFFGAVVIGFAPILVRLSEIGPTATAFHRFLLAIPVYWAVVAALPREEAAPKRRPKSARDFALIAMAGVWLAADMGVWHLSIGMTSVANSTLLANVAPVFVVLGGWILFRTRVTRTYLVGLALAMMGVAVLSQASLSLSGERFAGDLLGVLTGFFYACYQMTVERLRRRFDTLTIMLYAIPVSALVMLPFVLVSGESLLPGTLAGWAVLALHAAGPQVLGQGLIAWALAHLPVAFASVSLLVQPVTAAVVAWALFGEHVGPQQAAGAAVVLTGILLARRGSVRP